jgi:hypothetical protein
MPIKQLSPMEQTCTLFVNHPNFHILKILNNFNIILICLHIVHHESLEITGWTIIEEEQLRKTNLNIEKNLQ